MANRRLTPRSRLPAGVVTMELVGFDDGPIDVGDERVVAPVRPQLGVGGVGEPGAAHDEPDGHHGDIAPNNSTERRLIIRPRRDLTACRQLPVGPVGRLRPQADERHY